jgi:hypothetical protein
MEQEKEGRVGFAIVTARGMLCGSRRRRDFTMSRQSGVVSARGSKLAAFKGPDRPLRFFAEPQAPLSMTDRTP